MAGCPAQAVGVTGREPCAVWWGYGRPVVPPGRAVGTLGLGCIAAPPCTVRGSRDAGIPARAPEARVLRNPPSREPMAALTQTPKQPRRVRRPLGRPFAVAVGIVAILLTILSPTVAYGWTNYTFSGTAETKMVTLINQARASAGLPPVSVTSGLTSVARWRSK